MHNDLPQGALPISARPSTKVFLFSSRGETSPCPPVNDCDILEFLVWGLKSLVSMAQKFMSGGPESWIAVTSFLIDMVRDISLHTTVK